MSLGHWRQAGADVGHLALRLPGLGLALAHGWGKVSGLVTGEADRFVDGVAAIGFPFPYLFAWAAALAEFAGGLCLGLGLFTRTAAAFAAFTMSTAAFGRHKAHLHLLQALGLLGASPETVEMWGSPEMALVYLSSILGVLLLGPGRLSLDHLWAARAGRGKGG